MSCWKNQLAFHLLIFVIYCLTSVVSIAVSYLIDANADRFYKAGLDPNSGYVPGFIFRHFAPIVFFAIVAFPAEAFFRSNLNRFLLLPAFLFALLLFGFKANPLLPFGPARDFMRGRVEFAEENGLIKKLEEWAATATNRYSSEDLKEHEIPSFVRELAPNEWPGDVFVGECMGDHHDVVYIRFGGGGGGWGFVVNPQPRALPMPDWMPAFRVTSRTYAFFY